MKMRAYIKDEYVPLARGRGGGNGTLPRSSRLYTVMILNLDEGHVILDVDGDDIDDKYDIDDVIFIYYFNE